MSIGVPLNVTAHLASPLAGEPPQLDALLEFALTMFQCRSDQRPSRAFAAPRQGLIRIPICRRWLGNWLVAECSDPVIASPSAEFVEHINKRLGVENAAMLSKSGPRIVSSSSSWTKSHRIPLRVRSIDKVRWCCVGSARGLKKTLKHITAIGSKTADGYGRVARWEIERAGEDSSWFAKHERGPVLMRTLPAGEWLPDDLRGFRKSFGACSPPYWHPDRFGEIVCPC